MRSIMGCVTWSSVFLIISSQPQAQLMCETTTDPAQVEFIDEDLRNFVQAMVMLKEVTDSAAVIQHMYVDRASPGLKEFLRENEVGAADYLDLIRERPEHYGSLYGFSEFLKSCEQDVRAQLSQLKEIIPAATFLPVYYLVGFYSGLHAEPSPYGLLLAFGNPDRKPRNLSNTVVHETIHVQQALAVGLEEYQSIYGPKRTLLALTIREGVARFLTELTTGHVSNRKAYEYYLKHEPALVRRFQSERDSSSAGDWMWARPKDPDQPQQVGYVLGSMIVKAYYDKARDKRAAVDEILAVTDYPLFYEASGFAAGPALQKEK